MPRLFAHLRKNKTYTRLCDVVKRSMEQRGINLWETKHTGIYRVCGNLRNLREINLLFPWLFNQELTNRNREFGTVFGTIEIKADFCGRKRETSLT